MKNAITLLIMLLISISSFSQGGGINYKAVVKDSIGNIIANDSISLRFTIFREETTFSYAVYAETHSTKTNNNGIVILNIGEGTPDFDNSFSDIEWSGKLLLEVNMDFGSGDIYMPLTEFKSVPFAKYAERAGNAITHLYQLSDAKSDSDGDNDGSSIFLGKLAGQNDDESDNHNSSVGYRSMYSNTTGSNNVAVGHTALEDNTTGYGNVAIGSDALSNNTEGDNNIALGIAAGFQNTLGSGNVFIGYNSGGTNPESSNRLYINNKESNNPLIYGEFDTDLIRINGDFEVNDGNSTRFKVLENGNVIAGGPLTIQNASDASSTWRLETRPNGSLSMYRNGGYLGFFSASTGNYSSGSDRRIKKDITTLENGTLNKVMQLNPVSYLMKDQTDTNRNLGLISQEVQEVFPSLTHYVKESDLLTLSYTELIPILIKALQEQQGIIDGQKNQIEILSTDNSSLKNSVKDLITRVEKIEAKNQ